jgi:CrcB protein
MPVLAVLFGRDLAMGVMKAFAGPQESPKRDQAQAHHKMLDGCLVAGLGVAVVATTVSLVATNAVSVTDAVSCSVGPIGALTRFALSKFVNPIFENFMLGTFSANVIACVIAGALGSCKLDNDWCEYSVVGIAGSLSTVSSWATETLKIYTKKSPEWAYFYCLFSVAVGVAVTIPFAPN